jgi:SM-20-related protein
MGVLEFDLLRQATVETSPFEYLILPRFVNSEFLGAIQRDFPAISDGGSYPLGSLTYGPAFRELVGELLSDEMRDILADKFEMELEGRPATLTVRGRTREKDGKIHIDSKTKLITVLLYLNRQWDSQGGRLRLLRSAHDLEDVIAEVPPEEGSLVVFRCRPNAWHGHHPYVGERRSLQLNYVVDSAASRWSSVRHRLSAVLKGLRH